MTAESTTTVDEIGPQIYRISTPVAAAGGFTFNQILVVDEAPLLFHTGPRALFGAVREAVGRVLPVERLRYVGLSHVEADECGALNEWLAAAPGAEPVCSAVAAMVSIGDLADRPPRALADGETLSLGQRSLTWVDAPHVPHGWDCGYLFEETTRTLLCGDLFTQGGAEHPAVTSDEALLERSEGFRGVMDYFAHAPHTGATLERLAALSPATLACMHGSAFTGDGAALLRGLATRLAGGAP